MCISFIKEATGESIELTQLIRDNSFRLIQMN